MVRAVLFHSPTCPHCRQVIEHDLPPLLERYGASLRIAAVDASRPDGNALYRAAVMRLGISPERTGVPTLVVGSEVLVGSLEIPTRLPGLVDEGRAEGGVEWPPVPRLREAVEAPEPIPEIEFLTGNEDAHGVMDRFLGDPVANTAAVGVLAVLVGALVVVGRAAFGSARIPSAPSWVLPALAAAGAGVAAYLSLAEVTGAELVCGPVGDCTAVQQSRYARLFGIVPVGVLGLVGYVGILGLRGLAAAASAEAGKAAWALIWAMALFGTVLSLYLTFLEPFVLGATCLWCLASALLITGVLLTATPRALGRDGPGAGATGRPG